MASRRIPSTVGRQKLIDRSLFSFQPFGSSLFDQCRASFVASTTARVEASACFKMARYVARLPFIRDWFVLANLSELSLTSCR